MHTFHTNFQGRRKLETGNGRKLAVKTWLNFHTMSMRQMGEMIGKLRDRFWSNVFSALRQRGAGTGLDRALGTKKQGIVNRKQKKREPGFGEQVYELIFRPRARIRDSLAGRRTESCHLNCGPAAV